MPKAKELPAKQREGLLCGLRVRFEAHMSRHPDIEWTTVQARLEARSSRLSSLVVRCSVIADTIPSSYTTMAPILTMPPAAFAACSGFDARSQPDE
jgi:hypothetical protein